MRYTINLTHEDLAALRDDVYTYGPNRGLPLLDLIGSEDRRTPETVSPQRHRVVQLADVLCDTADNMVDEASAVATSASVAASRIERCDLGAVEELAECANQLTAIDTRVTTIRRLVDMIRAAV